MAEITLASTASVSSIGLHPGAQKLRPAPCGETISAGMACYIKEADGKIYRSSGAAANEAARVHGFAPYGRTAGEYMTLVTHCEIGGYSSGLTTGKPLYVSGANPGKLADAASTGGTKAVAFAVSATDIQVLGASLY